MKTYAHIKEKTQRHTFSFKKITLGLPGGSVAKNPSAKAGDMGSIPGLGSPHMPWCNSACVPKLLSLRALAPVLRRGEAAGTPNPRTATRESLCAAIGPGTAKHTTHVRKTINKNAKMTLPP